MYTISQTDKKEKIKFAQPRKNPNPIPELPPRKTKNIAQIIKQIRKDCKHWLTGSDGLLVFMEAESIANQLVNLIREEEGLPKEIEMKEFAFATEETGKEMINAFVILNAIHGDSYISEVEIYFGIFKLANRKTTVCIFNII